MPSSGFQQAREVAALLTGEARAHVGHIPQDAFPQRRHQHTVDPLSAWYPTDNHHRQKTPGFDLPPAGHALEKVIYIFQHHSKQFGLYYDLQTTELVSETPGGQLFPTCTLVLGDTTFIPVPTRLQRRSFLPTLRRSGSRSDATCYIPRSMFAKKHSTDARNTLAGCGTGGMGLPTVALVLGARISKVKMARAGNASFLSGPFHK
jgi:hypothetical protein